jgi:hypothetical protein
MDNSLTVAPWTFPAGTFKVPTPLEVELNPPYWNGFTNEGIPACANLASPAGIADWPHYCDQWQVAKVDADNAGWPDAQSAGFNDCLLVGAQYLWSQHPQSGANKVIES